MKLPYNVERQVPEFVRKDHPAFVEFLKAYYQWYEEEYSIGKLQTLVDIDDTIAEFVQYFKQQLDVTGAYNAVDNRLYLKHIKELYASKGSTNAFKFLFRILFNVESDVTLPWDYVFKPSMGQWEQDTSILVSFKLNGESFDPSTLIGDSVYVFDDYSTQYTVFVNNVIQRADNLYELFIERVVTRSSTLVSIKTRDGLISGVLVPTITNVTIMNAGVGFEVGQVFNIESFGGSGTLIKVKSVTSTGGITAVEIVQFGINYETNFDLYISPSNSIVGADIEQARISLLGSNTVGGVTSATNASYITNDNMNVQTDRGLIVRHDYTISYAPDPLVDPEDPTKNRNYMTDPTYVGDVVGAFRTRAITTGKNDSNARLLFNLGYLLKYPGYYASSQNIVGDSVYIQDSYYYQVYSYVTTLEKTIDSYSTILKKVLHPTGTKHFATYQVNNVLSPTLSVVPSINIINKADAFREIVQPSDTSTLSVYKSFSDQATPTDVFDRVVQYVRANSDFVDPTTSELDVNIATVTDAISSLTIGVAAVDTVSVTESILVEPTTLISDTVSVSESFVLNVDKYIDDGVAVTTSGGIFIEPYYANVTTTLYWDAGYADNEYPITE